MDDEQERAFVDLHCHSSASFDSLSRPADIVRVAAARGLTHLAITDHERIDGALRARDLAPPGLTVIIGEEIRSRGGDVIGLYLERAVPAGLSLLDTVAAIQAEGGVAGLPHPFDRFRSSGARERAEEELEEIAQRVDYVETFNARVPYAAANTYAAEFAEEYGVPGVAASDAHTLMEVGVAYTVLHGRLASAAELRTALAATSLVMSRASFVARTLGPWAQLVQRFRGNRRVLPRADAGARSRR